MSVVQVKERPILFNGEMVRAILDGRKTVTRRLVPNWQEPIHQEDGDWLAVAQRHPRWGFGVSGKDAAACAVELARSGCCPYGKPGERLWVRETFSGASAYEAQGYPLKDWGNKIWYWADGNPLHGDWTRPRPSIHMPRCLSRILLEITDVRVERLQSITEEQARAEGITDGGCTSCGNHEPCGCERPSPDAVDSFVHLWNSTGGDWGANPWVWVVEFKPVTV